MNGELPDFQAIFRKSRGTRDQIANNHWNIEKAREFQKNMYFCFIDYAKAFYWGDHNNLWTFFKRWEYQTTLRISWETCRQAKMQQLEPYIEQLTGSKLGKEYNKAVYCLPPYWTWASLVAQLLKNPPEMQEIRIRSLSWEDPLEKGKATHSSILA